MSTDTGAIMLAPGAGTHFRFWSGEEFTWKVTGASSGGALDIGELLVQPGIGVPEHIHHANDETFFVMDGTFHITIAGREQTMGAGAFAFIPRGLPHCWANVGAEPARLLLIFTPAAWTSTSSSSTRCCRGRWIWPRSSPSWRSTNMS